MFIKFAYFVTLVHCYTLQGTTPSLDQPLPLRAPPSLPQQAQMSRQSLGGDKFGNAATETSSATLQLATVLNFSPALSMAPMS